MGGSQVNDAAARALDLHQDRREAAVPTLSVLLGPPALGLQAFTSWAARSGFWPSPVSASAPETLTFQIAAALRTHPDIRLRAVELVAEASHTPVKSVLALVDSHCRDASVLFERAATGGPQGAFACALLGRGPATSQPAVSDLTDVLESATRRPALVVALRDDSAHDRFLQESARLVEQAPELILAVALQRLPQTTGTASTPRDARRWVTMVREGLIPLPPEPIPPAPSDLSERHLRERAHLVEGGHSASAVRAFDQVARVPAPHSPHEDSGARSAEEALLYQVLQEHAETTGLFELNGKMDFDFGPRPMEVDLVSRRLGIAIEIDGYYHFNGPPEPYRRDRRKDELLQQHGYLILRFLAEDIGPKLQQVLRTIIRNVRHTASARRRRNERDADHR